MVFLLYRYDWIVGVQAISVFRARTARLRTRAHRVASVLVAHRLKLHVQPAVCARMPRFRLTAHSESTAPLPRRQPRYARPEIIARMPPASLRA
jgi:hypothetical protein